MRSAAVLLFLFSCICFCKGQKEYFLGQNFDINDADVTKRDKNVLIIPNIGDGAKFDGKISSIEFNAHKNGKFSVVVLRKSDPDSLKYEIVGRQDFRVKKSKAGRDIQEDVEIPVKAGDVVGIYAKKIPLGYKINSCTGKNPSAISNKPSDTEVGTELNFGLVNKKKNRCRSYPVKVTYKGQECIPAPTDVYVVVDISKSISDSDLETTRGAMHHIFNNFEISDSVTRIGVIKYKDDTAIEIPLGQSKSLAELLATPVLTRGIKEDQKAGTRTDLAMNQMMDEMAKVPDSERSKVCILFTDGKATATAAEMKAMTTRLENTDIFTVVVGLGRETDNDELASIATGPDMENVHHVANYKNLLKTAQAVVDDVCKEVLPGGPPPPTTTLPPPVCEGEPLDVYFVVDISKSISAKELEAEQAVVRFFLNNLNIASTSDGARVALIKFHNFAEEEFGLDVYSSREQLKDVDILTRGFIRGGTRTDQAMELMMDKYEADTATGRKQVSILLTDGKATADLTDMIARLEGKPEIKSIAVGIGAKAVESELASIATGPGSENVYMAGDFDELMNIVREVVSQACTP